MTTFVDTGRPGKKRFRVRFQGNGGSRTACFAHAFDAYREFYLREREAWENASEAEIARKRDITVKSLMNFYFGRLCDEVELNRISRAYFKGQYHNFCLLQRQLKYNNTPVRQISPPDLAGITVHNHRLFLRRAWALAVETGFCSRNPCRVVRSSLHQSSSVSPEKFATHDQVRALMAAGDTRLRLAVYLGAACGLRISEVAALRSDNVAGDLLVIDSHLTDAGILPGLKYGCRTVIPVTEEFHSFLQAVPRTGRFLFEKKGGGHYANTASFRRRVVKPAFDAIGMTAQRKSFHALRHYAVAVWASRGIPPEQISRWLDHSSPAVTLATYSHLFTHNKHRCHLISNNCRSI